VLLLLWDLLVALVVLGSVTAFLVVLFLPARRRWVPSEVISEVMAEAAAAAAVGDETSELHHPRLSA